MLHALIMAGGGGTRFWPRSRQDRPKQFLALAGERTLLQQAYDRLEAQAPPERTWIMTARRYVEETARQLPELARSRLVGEPCGRDTAPCIALGAALIARLDPDAVVVITPADHVIEPVQEFRRAVHAATLLAEEHPHALVTIGIPPTYPATGYGYIQRGAALDSRQGIAAFRVQRFREKPHAEQAEQMLATGEYLWNAGIFVGRAAAILSALREHQPAIHAAVERIADAWNTPQQDAVFQREYEALPKISIDYAVVEKAREVLTVQAPFQWDDLGGWLALERRSPQDADGNTILAQHCGVHTKDCLIVADAGRLIATVDVSNLLIVQDGDAILVADRRAEGSLRQLIDKMKQDGLEKHL